MGIKRGREMDYICDEYVVKDFRKAPYALIDGVNRFAF